ncbi:hypothetical protein JMM63_11655 [Rhodovulum sulfidophilum]|uniref:Uncharacterized protein n=1 Tax=Rhodovulum sulfidophilum TaxID=35806 RepID=A0ABS1S1V6_RHOSU|nr:hypothetical protein [Rhodovulum sulfidophilum]MBL3596220.1 hypothetical protein [Rhodovulum sulfidophilum]MBL3611315.1 hypothetical protein [Rhodovulum sulfidophilum]MCE8419717.1 hypothetical protein [Rhodovulum sulfidophilum]MCE8455428.1 hypothetical protein [Rhodovulum sulfidophilum]
MEDFAIHYCAVRFRRNAAFFSLMGLKHAMRGEIGAAVFLKLPRTLRGYCDTRRAAPETFFLTFL